MEKSHFSEKQIIGFLDVSRSSDAPGSHLCGLSLEGRGAFPAQG
ncbi:hypothetical protein PhaeoP72_03913 (plasmid) [Phaeobacter inhibens]|nr:hypothetical protein PhaeoP72_03913 [Phaeobacter inhibens]